MEYLAPMFKIKKNAMSIEKRRFLDTKTAYD